MFLPSRALFLLAEYLKLSGRTCRAHTAKGHFCKHGRSKDKLFCAQHMAIYSRKIGSKMKFGEYLAIFGEMVDMKKLKWPIFIRPKDLWRENLLLKITKPRRHGYETTAIVRIYGPVDGCLCAKCCQVRREGGSKICRCKECVMYRLRKHLVKQRK